MMTFWLIVLFIVLPACIGLAFLFSLGRWQITTTPQVDEQWRQQRIADLKTVQSYYERHESVARVDRIPSRRPLGSPASSHRVLRAGFTRNR